MAHPKFPTSQMLRQQPRQRGRSPALSPAPQSVQPLGARCCRLPRRWFVLGKTKRYTGRISLSCYDSHKCSCRPLSTSITWEHDCLELAPRRESFCQAPGSPRSPPAEPLLVRFCSFLIKKQDKSIRLSCQPATRHICTSPAACPDGFMAEDHEQQSSSQELALQEREMQGLWRTTRGTSAAPSFKCTREQ